MSSLILSALFFYGQWWDFLICEKPWHFKAFLHFVLEEYHNNLDLLKNSPLRKVMWDWSGEPGQREPGEHWWWLLRAIWLGQLGRVALAFSKLRKQGSADGLQNVSLAVSVTDQEAAAGRSPNGVSPLPSRDTSAGSACRTGSVGFSCSSQWSCAGPAKAARLEDPGTASAHPWFKQCFIIPCQKPRQDKV